MKVARAWSMALIGVDAQPVEVEVSIGGGLPRTVLVGLPDSALYEARDRCRAAVGASGRSWPSHLVTINLSPATLPKAGSHYDLAIVAALLAAHEQIPIDALNDTVLLGELGLDARVRGVRGVLPALLAARQLGSTRAIVPAACLREARLVEGLTIWGVSHLDEMVQVLCGESIDEPALDDVDLDEASPTPDLVDVVGQMEGRWGVEVAAAGGHHLYLHGPPGVGKTLLAERLPGLLPDLTIAESLEVSAIHSVLGQGLEGGLIQRPPFAAPHHSSSVAALVGGGARVAAPGAISRAHHGVLFLDEAPEFSMKALEALRQPLESGRVELARSAAVTIYPARFQLVLAANPCPCGMAGTPGAHCRCAPMTVRRYAERVSGPIVDRIDIHAQLYPLRQSLMRLAGDGVESTAVVAARVREARERQRRRLAPWGFTTNGTVPGPLLRREFPPMDGDDIVDGAVARGQLSARGVDKVLKVAWTLADLAGRDRPHRSDVRAALAMRRSEEAKGAA